MDFDYFKMSWLPKGATVSLYHKNLMYGKTANVKDSVSYDPYMLSF